MTSTTVTYTNIDADTHITEPPDVWTARVPAKFRDRVPVMTRDAQGQDIWTLDGEQIYTVKFSAPAGWPTPFPDGPPTLGECHPASHDPHARLAFMDTVGTWAQVLYPNVAGFGSQKFLRLDDDELKLACVRAYNDFLRDFASADPRRLVTICSTPFWDIDATIAEVTRCLDAGHRGILFTGEPHRFGLPLLGDRHWDPLWSLAQDARVPIHFHIGSGNSGTSFTPQRIAVNGSAATYGLSSVELFLGNGIQVADLLLSGVCQRFPDIAFVSVESGVGWIPFVLEAVDHSYLEGRPGRECEWPMLPSQYFARNVYACAWFERTAFTHLVDVLPMDNILFETDFPHPTCLYGNVAERIEHSLGALAPDLRRKVLWENAARLYRIESPA